MGIASLRADLVLLEASIRVLAVVQLVDLGHHEPDLLPPLVAHDQPLRVRRPRQGLQVGDEVLGQLDRLLEEGIDDLPDKARLGRCLAQLFDSLLVEAVVDGANL